MGFYVTTPCCPTAPAYRPENAYPGLSGICSHSSLQIHVYSPPFRAALLDANGNTTELVNNDGGFLAHYEYSAYGEVINSSGSEADNNPFRFSTKYWDRDTSLLYYGYRYYDSVRGRWVGRDPQEEDGGVNLYIVLGNQPVSRFDYLGLLVAYFCRVARYLMASLS